MFLAEKMRFLRAELGQFGEELAKGITARFAKWSEISVVIFPACILPIEVLPERDGLKKIDQLR